ncbi:hypothetical protein [Rhodoblastus sp.]|jgi:hypothetical protein|uniref:hypothetical protein n=1 Tax=Rhodoblastus sp. TaxID=1962975 RepID=UPI0025FED635|nr:hypothetical protein [Rhodoblastus sp.]
MLTNSHDYLRPANEAERIYLESLVQEDFSWCHPGETLDDLRRRAPFSREDQGLLREWMEFAAARAAMRGAAAPAGAPLAEAAEQRRPAGLSLSCAKFPQLAARQA